MSRMQHLGCLFLAAVTGVQLASAQAAPSDQNRGETSSSMLHLSVTLGGNSAGEVQKSDIKLLDNGAPVEVQTLQQPQASGEPTHVILVIDDVNARYTTIAYERDELKKFFTRNEGRLSVPFAVAVMTDTKTNIQQGFSQNGMAENDVLQKYPVGLHEIRRDSQYGGIDRANIGIRAMEELVRYAATLPGHKVILFVSPGWPLLSGPHIQLTGKEAASILETVSQLQNALLRSDITLDMINPFGPEENLLRSDYYQGFLRCVSKPTDVDIADLSLQVLALHSGGTVLQGSSDIAGLVGRSVAELDHRYTLGFTPAVGGAAAVCHSLKVEVGRPGVTVRAPDQYYGAPSGR